MKNLIDQIISDNKHGSTVLFKQAVQYFLTIDEERFLLDIKRESKKLADHFYAMGLFQKLNAELQKIQSTKKLEHLSIPLAFDYFKLQGLSAESKDRLTRVRPETLGQASRVSGIRPTDITLIGISLQKVVSRETQ